MPLCVAYHLVPCLKVFSAYKQDERNGTPAANPVARIYTCYLCKNNSNIPVPLLSFFTCYISILLNIQGLQYQKLTELILKNNIQCKLYSKANFQFEFLARIGFCCPKLRVFDVFGTDTWADCLIALFFKDAFHSLHRLVVNTYKQLLDVH